MRCILLITFNVWVKLVKYYAKHMMTVDLMEYSELANTTCDSMLFEEAAFFWDHRRPRHVDISGRRHRVVFALVEYSWLNS